MNWLSVKMKHILEIILSELVLNPVVSTALNHLTVSKKMMNKLKGD